MVYNRLLTMKRCIVMICLVAIALTSYAQEEKKAANRPPSPEMTAIQTAIGLAKYGYANYSATALAEAAKILAETPVQDLDVAKQSEGGQKSAEKSTLMSFEPTKLIADAKKYAGKDKVTLAYISQIEKSINKSATRGAVGGPKRAASTVNARSTDRYICKFWAGELAEVAVIGDGDCDLDLYIYDENGNLIASDTDYTDQCICRWVPSWTGAFTIKIVNRGYVYSNYIIATN